MDFACDGNVKALKVHANSFPGRLASGQCCLFRSGVNAMPFVVRIETKSRGEPQWCV